MQPKDFQKKTADRIVELFQKGQKRVLLADEVGLGKTIVAKSVVEQIKSRYEKNNKRFVVVYICSNAGIAAQNCKALGISEQLSIDEGRLSMQHIRVHFDKDKPEQLIPMTPSTSFKLTNGGRSVHERALMFVVMSLFSEFSPYSDELNEFLQYLVKDETWTHAVNQQFANVGNCEEKFSGYLEYIEEEFYKVVEEEEYLHSQLDTLKYILKKGVCYEDERRKIIGDLRMIFARISLGMIKPDLVIMDEFQRFKDLVCYDENDNSDAALLSKNFLSDNSDTKVLLLSATPYKPYSTSDEISGGESHYREFMQVIDFLINDSEKQCEFRKLWSNYSASLNELSADKLSVIIANKNSAEDAMYGLMTRTERRSNAIIDTSKAGEIPASYISEEDMSSYIEMQALIESLGIGGRIHMDYIKSAPWLLSFMDYKIKKQINERLKNLPTEDARALIESSSDLLIKSSDIRNYKKISKNNARLSFILDEIFSGKDSLSGPEMLLWIPASKPHYRVPKTVFDKNSDYSKLLVFSSWEMVPRVISTLVSYEAERRARFGKGYEMLDKNGSPVRYYTHDYEDEDESTDTRRKNTSAKHISKDIEQLFLQPYPHFVDYYNPEEYKDCTLSEVVKDIKSKIKTTFAGDKRPVARGAGVLRSFLENPRIASKIPNLNDNNTLTLIAYIIIASPANCVLRMFGIKNETSYTAAAGCAKEFVKLFNRRESYAILKALYNRKDDYYYESVFRYCAEGNLQAVLEEYYYVLNCSPEDFPELLKGAIAKTTNLKVETRENYLHRFAETKRGATSYSLRTHFAAGYFDVKRQDKSVQSAENIRNAFNSPFRPFVLATTSIGQEGLNFHLYCSRIAHWNLPHNPVELEQREGRINRYMCHAIRKNVAANTEGKTWDECFELTKQKYGKDKSDLIPYWSLPDEYFEQEKYCTHIERIVPIYPYSREVFKYEHLTKVLALYRLTMGQPRQDEILRLINNENISSKDLEKLYFNLSPYEHTIQGI